MEGDILELNKAAAVI